MSNKIKTIVLFGALTVASFGFASQRFDADADGETAASAFVADDSPALLRCSPRRSSSRAFSFPVPAGTDAAKRTPAAFQNWNRDFELIADEIGKKLSLPSPVTTEQTSWTTVTDAFRAMGVTGSYTSEPEARSDGYRLAPAASLQKGNSFQVYQGIDIVDFETGGIQDFLLGRGAFAGDRDPISHRGFIVQRYGVENEKVHALYKFAKERGAHSAVLVTDGPISVTAGKVPFATVTVRGQEKQADFSGQIQADHLSHGEQGLLLRSILNEGYRFYSPGAPKDGELVQTHDYYVTMSAAANPSLDRKPIQHMKEALLYILKDPARPVTPENVKKMYVFSGTGNWTRRHLNRTYLYEDRMTADDGPGRFALEHAMNVIENFVRADRTAKISDIKSPGLRRLSAPDGTFWEIGYTDGQLELNQRMVEFFLDVAKNPDRYAIEDVLLEHFVMTNKNVVDALYLAWKAMKGVGRPFDVVGMIDAKFVGLRSFGVSTLMVGYDVKTSFGQNRNAYPKEFSDAIKLAVQMEEIPGATNIDPDGPPRDRVLQHGKSTAIRWQRMDGGARTGPVFVDLFTGSYNNSNNYNNLERQDYIRLLAESEFHRAFRQSVLKIADNQIKAGRRALPLKDAVFVKEIAALLGQSPIDLDWGKILDVQRRMERLPFLNEANQQKLIQDVGRILGEEAQRPSRLMQSLQVSPATLAARLSVMNRFAKWYADLPSFKQGADRALSANEILAISIALMENSFSAKAALKNILWRADVPKHILEARTYRLYEYMQLERYFQESGKSPEKSVFPPSKDVRFGAESLPLENAEDIARSILGPKSRDAAKILIKALRARNDDEKMALIAEPAEIQRRIESFSNLIDVYEKIPGLAHADERPGSNLKPEYLMRQLLSENLDLLLLRDQPEDLLRETVRYLLSLKGFRDPAGAPGRLTEMTRRMMDQLTIIKGVQCRKVFL